MIGSLHAVFLTCGFNIEMYEMLGLNNVNLISCHKTIKTENPGSCDFLCLGWAGM